MQIDSVETRPMEQEVPVFAEPTEDDWNTNERDREQVSEHLDLLRKVFSFCASLRLVQKERV